jgi:branched-chain amino acid transport system substrate-binding protein
MIFGHNTLYFDLANASPLQKQFVQEYEAKYKDYPHWEADRATSRCRSTRRAWRRPEGEERVAVNEDIINAMEGVKVQSLGGPATCARTTSPSRPSTRASPRTRTSTTSRRSPRSTRCIRTSCRSRRADFWKWIETAQIKL